MMMRLINVKKKYNINFLLIIIISKKNKERDESYDNSIDLNINTTKL